MSKPIHKNIKKSTEMTTEVFSSILPLGLLFWLLCFTGSSPAAEGKGRTKCGNAETEGHKAQEN